VDFKAIEEKSFTSAAPVARPAKPVHAVVDFGARGISAIDGGSGATRGSNACVKKVLAELRHVAASDTRVWLNDGRGVHLFPAEGDLTQWRALVEGPEGSPFEGGVFSLVVRIPECYPMRPPSIRFETPVYHCNVSESGTICLGLLQGDWSPTLSVPKAIEAVRYMLKDPDTDNALRQWIAELTMASKTSGGTDTRYVDEARRHTQKEAAKSVAEWRQEWAAPTAAGDSS
jgi:ubiquitin-protein ligase